MGIDSMSARKKVAVVLVAILVLAALAAMVAYCSHANSPQRVRGHRVRAERRDVTRTLRLVGRVKPRSTTEVKSPVSGRLLSFLFREGDQVRAGQPIAIIEPDQSQSLLLGQARADLQLKLIALDTAQRDLDRARALAANGLIPNVDLERAKNTHLSVLNTVELARGQLTILERQTPQSSVGNRTFHLVAPVSGVLLAPSISAGETIVAGTNNLASGGTVVTKLADMSAFYVRVEISEVDVLNLKVDTPATIRPAAMSRKIRGHLAHIGTEGTTVQNVTTYRGDVELDDPVALLPEMSADVDLIVAERKSVVAVPTAAVVRTASGETFVRNGDTSRLMPVKSGLEGDDFTEIISGVTAGQLIEIVPVAGPSTTQAPQ